MKTVLAIETSCDDTSVAIVNSEGWVSGCLSLNQDVAHARFGGIVPEIASRNHSFQLLPLIEELLQRTSLKSNHLDGVAATNRPGLIGSLIVGVTTAKSLALAWNLPWIGINHLEGHVVAPFLKDSQYSPEFEFFRTDEPFLCLTVSGGHTSIYHVPQFGHYEILGATLDDAAGEAFDKFGKMLGFGFPGGVKVDHSASGGDPAKYDFPRGLIKEDHLSMSFSGLKSSAMRLIDELDERGGPQLIQQELSHLCSSFQEAVADVLVSKLDRALDQTGVNGVILTGGVSANSRLREKVLAWSVLRGVQLQIPPLRYCTDNAAMIGFAGAIRFERGESSDWKTATSPYSLPQDFQTVPAPGIDS